MNKKKILIETLRGSVAQLNELSSMTEGIDVYNATGHVDTEFLIEALSCVKSFMDASNTVVQKISSLLAPNAPTDEKKNRRRLPPFRRLLPERDKQKARILRSAINFSSSL